MSYILVICIVAPILSFLFVSEGKMRTCISFLLVGIFSCLFVSEVNGLIKSNIETDMFYLTTSVTPVTEELVKAIPLFFYAAVISDKLEDLLPNAFLLGIGFAVLENLVLLTNNIEAVNFPWAIVRGFSSGLMHGICTGMVGMCIAYIRRNRRIFSCGIIATFSLAMVYHSIFNSLVQGKAAYLNYIGFAMPITAFIPIVVFVSRRNKAAKGQ